MQPLRLTGPRSVAIRYYQ